MQESKFVEDQKLSFVSWSLKYHRLFSYIWVFWSLIFAAASIDVWLDPSTNNTIISALIAYLIIVALPYLLVRKSWNNYQNEWSERIRQEDFRNKVYEFENSSDHQLLVNYVARYKHILGQPNANMGSENKKLLDLLNQKGYDFNLEELFHMLYIEKDRLDYQELKNKINYRNPITLDQHIGEYLDVFWNKPIGKELYMFNKLLNEKGLNVAPEELSTLINEKKREIELNSFESQLRNKDYQKINIDTIDGHQFESLLTDVFSKLGYDTTNLPGSHDQGADLLIEKYGQKTVVQAKHYSSKVGNEAIQQVVASIKHYKADRGMVITTNEYTKSAIELARSNNIELVDRLALLKLIDRVQSF